MQVEFFIKESADHQCSQCCRCRRFRRGKDAENEATGTTPAKQSSYGQALRLLLIPAVAMVIMATVMRQTGSGVQSSFYVVWLSEYVVCTSETVVCLGENLGIKGSAIGWLIAQLADADSQAPNTTLLEALRRAFQQVESQGLDRLSPFYPEPHGGLSLPRLQELFAALNRLRELPIKTE